jgi:hypothetical protein
MVVIAGMRDLAGKGGAVMEAAPLERFPLFFSLFCSFANIGLVKGCMHRQHLLLHMFSA